MQQFLNPDQTSPILEAEMALRAEQLNSNSEHVCNSEPPGNRSSTQRYILTPESEGNQQAKQEVKLLKPQHQHMGSEKKSQKLAQADQSRRREEEKMEERQEPEGRQADSVVTERKKEVCLFGRHSNHTVTGEYLKNLKSKL